MIIKKTFEAWLQQFNKKLHIEPLMSVVAGKEERKENPDVDVLYLGKKRLCSVPKGLKTAKFWTDVINDKRFDSGYTTSDGIAHRSLSGIGLVLLMKGIIDSKQFVNHFVTKRNKELVERLYSAGILSTNPKE